MNILTTAVIKGGTGKTTTAAAIAQAAAKARKKVLCVDLDPQGNFTAFLDAAPTAPGCYELITGQAPAAGLIQKTGQKISVIAASPNLATLKTTPGSAKRLQAALEPVKGDFDLIMIDTPPQIGETTYNALQACNGLLIPLEADSSSLQGLYQILDLAQHMRENSNPDLSFIGVLLTRYDSRPNVNRYLKETIQETAQESGAAFLGCVRAGIAIREAQGMGQSLFEYAPKSNPAADYLEIYRAIKKNL